MFVETWTEDRVERLKQLWAGGLSCSQIGRELGGITRNAVIGKVARLGLPGRTQITQNRRYRGGPISYAEKLRRAAERAEHKAQIKAEQEARRLAEQIFQPKEIPQPDFLALTIDELKRRQCRYPRGEGIATRFCGQPAIAGSAYCEYCHAICHQRPRQPLPLQTGGTQTSVLNRAGGIIGTSRPSNLSGVA